MTLLEARRRILELGQDIVDVGDVAARLGVSTGYASKILSRLQRHQAATRLAGGTWAITDPVDRLRIPESLVAPALSYISLQTALFHHGMITQIPEVTYAVSTARTQRIATPLGVVSIHHIGPEFFSGYAPYGPGSIQMATPEKALLDVLYLGPARSRLFANLPEVELPRSFSIGRARDQISQIPFESRRAHVRNRFEDLVRPNRKK